MKNSSMARVRQNSASEHAIPETLQELARRAENDLLDIFKDRLVEVAVDGIRPQGGEVANFSVENGTVRVRCSFFVKQRTRESGDWQRHDDYPLDIMPQKAFWDAGTLVMEETVKNSTTITVVLHRPMRTFINIANQHKNGE